jgi:hypothetical protein
MKNFELIRPETLAEAFSVLKAKKEEKTFILAGGTDLLPVMRAGVLDVDLMRSARRRTVSRLALYAHLSRSTRIRSYRRISLTSAKPQRGLAPCRPEELRLWLVICVPLCRALTAPRHS